MKKIYNLLNKIPPFLFFSFIVYIVIKLNSKFGIFEDIELVTQISLFIEHDLFFEIILLVVSFIYTYKQFSLINRGYSKARLFIVIELFVSVIYVVYRLFPHCINTKFIGFSFLPLYYLDVFFSVFLTNLLFLIGSGKVMRCLSRFTLLLRREIFKKKDNKGRLYYVNELVLLFFTNLSFLIVTKKVSDFFLSICKKISRFVKEIKFWITEVKPDNDLSVYFNPDKPILNLEEIKNDIVRRRYVELITNKIRSITKTKDITLDVSYSIGIIAKWGEGKTSFINLLKEQLEREKSQYIIIDFNPWKSSNIPTYFFNILANKLQPYDGGINLVIHSYLRTLQSFDKTNVLKLILDFRDLRLNHQSEFDLIEKAIGKTGKKIIIFIDDIDRLYGDEIISVLKLIRNTANFKNTIFISAYDKGYLNEAIKKSVSNYNYLEFAEKIFDEEIVLPMIYNKSINDFLEKEIEKEVSAIKLMNEIDGKTLKVISNLLITNFRDAKRFLNLFIPILEKLKDELIFSDLFIIQAIYYKHKDVYVAIRDGSLLDMKNGVYEPLEDEKLVTIIKNKGVSEECMDDFILLIKALFTNHKRKGISQNGYFLDYFQHEVITRPSNSEILGLLEKNTIDNTKIEEWKKFGLSNLFDAFADSYSDINSQSEFEQCIKYLFYISDELKNDNKAINLIKRFMIKDKVEKVISRFYEGKLEKYKNFILSLLRKVSVHNAYLIQQSIIHYLSPSDAGGEIGLERLIFNKKELQDEILSFFKKYIKLNKSDEAKFENRLLFMYTCCIESRQNKAYIKIKEASKLFRAWIDENHKFYLDNLIQVENGVNPEIKIFSFQEDLLQLFCDEDEENGYTNFKIFLNEKRYKYKDILDNFIKEFEWGLNKEHIEVKKLDNSRIFPSNLITLLYEEDYDPFYNNFNKVDYKQRYKSFFGDYIEVNEALKKALG